MSDNIRIKVKKQIKSYIENPGFFSILILGDAGTGKEYMLKEILEEKELDNEYLIFYPYQIGNTKKKISKIFKPEYIIIKNAEELSDIQQNILFRALSTNNGEIGLSKKNRGLKRIIFISSFNVEQLRESKKYWSDRFWDRAAQLAVKLPSFKDYSADIKNDFKSVWEKMKFKEFKKLPEDINFYEWLKNNCGTFAGNFRDLDKIAILWHQYRIIEYSELKQQFKVDVETRVFRRVREHFESFTHFPVQKADYSNIFEFEKGRTWEQIERGFKSKFKKWAKENYGTIKKATLELNMPLRKMDKW